MEDIISDGQYLMSNYFLTFNKRLFLSNDVYPFILVADSLTWHEIFNLMGGCNRVTFLKSFVLFPIVISGDADTAEPAELELSTKVHEDFTVHRDNRINRHLSMVCRCAFGMPISDRNFASASKNIST